MNLQAKICKVLVLYRILYFFLKGVPFLLESGNALFLFMSNKQLKSFFLEKL